MQINSKLGVLMGIAVVLLVAVAFAAFSSGKAATASSVAHVDTQRLLNQYVFPQVEKPLKTETDRLQKELDAKLAKLTSDDEKKKVFDEYQGRLEVKKQQLVDAQLAKVREVVAKVGKDQGFSVVLDNKAVISGGKDITDSVLAKLGVTAKK